MNNPLVHAFFVGRALSELLYEQAGKVLTNTLSDLSKLDAELREQLHQFSEQVLQRASQDEEAAMQGRVKTTNPFTQATSESVDLQALIDELRAEVAQLRSELKRYRNNQVS